MHVGELCDPEFAVPAEMQGGACACAEHHKATAHIRVVIFFIGRLGSLIQFHTAALLHADGAALPVAPRHRQVERHVGRNAHRRHVPG